MIYTAVYKIVSYSVYVLFFFLLSLTYHQHCLALQAFLLKEFFLQRWRPCCFPAIPVTIVAIVTIVTIVATVAIVVIVTPIINASEINAVQCNACDGKSNSSQIQNHSKDDLKNKNDQLMYKKISKP